MDQSLEVLMEADKREKLRFYSGSSSESCGSYVNMKEESLLKLAKRKAIAEVRERGLKKRYSLLKQKLEIEMELEQHDISTELEEIKILQTGEGDAKKLITENVVCSICRTSHKTVNCQVLLDKSPEERFSLVWKLRLCLNCFDTDHIAQECDSNDRCAVAVCRKDTAHSCIKMGWEKQVHRPSYWNKPLVKQIISS